VPRICRILSLLVACTAAAFAQEIPTSSEGSLQSDLRREGEQFHDDCFSADKKFFSCLTDLVHSTPLHLTGGSFPPGNGFGAGPAFGWEHNLNESWRSATNVEAMASSNQSWMVGVNFRAIEVSNKPLVPTFHRPVKGTAQKVELQHDPEVNLFAEAISLNKLSYYGIGPSTSRPSLALYGMRAIMIGGNVNYPLGNSGVALFGELSARLFSLRGREGDASPSIEQLYSSVTAPGLAQGGGGFFQPSEGIRFDRDLSSYFILNYSATLQEFAGTASNSFERLNLDFSHTIPLYKLQKSAQPSKPAGGKAAPAEKTRNRDGSIDLEARLVESFVPSGNIIPFYVQPTLGGADINGEKMLASYPDYRFRAPNLMLFRADIEHSIWGPIGAMFLVDTGKVAVARGDLGFQHLLHSYAVGLTIRAGGYPMVQLLFAWGGHEGTHTIATINPALTGGGSRPSLY
jgi:hypothetical protein